MEIKKNKIIYSPTDLNNYVACKYIIKNDLSARDLGLKKKVKSADLKLRINMEMSMKKIFKSFISKIQKNY